MKNTQIGIFVGSLRRESYSRKLAECIIRLAPADFNFKIIHIGHLPFYNQDFDDNFEVPDAVREFRQTVKALDGVLFCTPEYNRSINVIKLSEITAYLSCF